jgi:hypothetical protein
MDPLTRGASFHDIQARFFGAASSRRAARHRRERRDARLVLEQTTTKSPAREHDELAPAVERVWADEVASIRRDLLAWLHYLARDGEEWQPARFEFAFGPFPVSATDSVRDVGDARRRIQLRGAIDSDRNEQADNLIRVTDHKTDGNRTGSRRRSSAAARCFSRCSTQWRREALRERGQPRAPLLLHVRRQLLRAPDSLNEMTRAPGSRCCG